MKIQLHILCQEHQFSVKPWIIMLFQDSLLYLKSNYSKPQLHKTPMWHSFFLWNEIYCNCYEDLFKEMTLLFSMAIYYQIYFFHLPVHDLSLGKFLDRNTDVSLFFITCMRFSHFFLFVLPCFSMFLSLYLIKISLEWPFVKKGIWLV